MKPYVSGSSLPIAAKCSASTVLPQVQKIGEKDRIGSALHDHMKDRVAYGVSEAMVRLDLIAQRWDLDESERNIFRGRAYSFEWCPPKGAMSEVAMCFCDDGSTVFVKGGRGQYDDLPDNAVFPIQVDLVWSEPEPLYREGQRARCPKGSTLWVPDLKTGRAAYVDPVETNLQVIAGCVAAARLTGAEVAVPAVIFWEKGQGTWDVPAFPLNVEKLGQAEAIIRDVIHRRLEERTRYLNGEPLRYTIGNHCTYCNAETHCAAKVGAIKRLLEDPRPLDHTALTPLQARQLAEMLPSIELFAKKAKEAMVAFSDTYGAVDVGHGRAWGAYQEPRTELDPVIARQVLIGELGPESAAKAFEAKTSKTSIEEAIKAAYRALAADGVKRPVAPVMRRVMAEIKERGGAVQTLRTFHGVHQAAPTPAPITAPKLPPAPIGPEVEIDGDD